MYITLYNMALSVLYYIYGNMYFQQEKYLPFLKLEEILFHCRFFSSVAEMSPSLKIERIKK